MIIIQYLSSAERQIRCGLLLPADAGATTRSRVVLICCEEGAAAVQSVAVFLCSCGAAEVLLRLRGSRLVQKPCIAHTMRFQDVNSISVPFLLNSLSYFILNNNNYVLVHKTILLQLVKLPKCGIFHFIKKCKLMQTTTFATYKPKESYLINMNKNTNS